MGDVSPCVLNMHDSHDALTWSYQSPSSVAGLGTICESCTIYDG